MLRSLLPLLAALILLFENGAHGQGVLLRLGHAGGPGSIQAVAAEEFAARVNKELGSEAQLTVYGNSALGNDTDLLKKLRTGDVELAIIAAPMSSVADEFGVFDMPFLVRGRAHVRLFRKALMEKYLQPAVQAKGYRVLGMWEFGVRHVTNGIRPIKVPHDLDGLRFRVPKAEWRIKMFESYGVKVTPMEIKDIYPSLQQGKLDGLEMPLPVLCSLDIHKVQKYLSLTGHLYSPAFLVIDEAQFQRLPANVRKVLPLQAQAIEDWVLERGEELDASWLARVKETMEVNEADRFTFTLLAMAIYREFVSKVPNGKAMMKLVFETDPKPFANSSP
ncbi:MAG: TRAP transporter substrate-binding protein [Rhodomicrobium sp.]